jgi:hypothetical protein
MIRYIRIGLLALMAAGFAWVQQGSDEQIIMSPANGESGKWGIWTLTYNIGSTPMASGGNLRIQLPYVWHGYYRNSPHAMQTVDQFAPNYVSAHSTNPNVRLSWEVEGGNWQNATSGLYVKNRKTAIDGRENRYAFVLRVTVEEGTLERGDVLSVIYGDTSEGSPGFYGPITAPVTEQILMEIDYNGNGKYRTITDAPSLTALPGAPVEMVATVESNGVVGVPAELHLSLLDLNYNGALGADRSIRLRVRDGAADVPAAIVVDGDKAWADVTVVPRETGILRIDAVTDDGALAALSNPMLVTETEPERRVYWGDLHSHGYMSWDGSGKDYFSYARYLADLDFYALTDHAGNNINEETMQDLAQDIIRWYEPHKFATILAYEISYGSPYGHHNVFFRGTEMGFYIDPTKMKLPEFIRALKEGYALAIPHGLNHEPRYEKDPRIPVAEIYSLWGTSELDDQADGLSYGNSDWKLFQIQDPNKTKRPNPGYTQNLWRNGVELGVIASTDDHRGRPGKRRGGIAAVYAPELTREAVFDAVRDKYTYGTTGDRILLDFSINGTRQGAKLRATEPRLLQVDVHGTDDIAWVEILKLSQGAEDYELLHRVEPAGMDISLTVEDTDNAAAMYYVRVRQKAEVRRRPVHAWSSPIWVE